MRAQPLDSTFHPDQAIGVKMRGARFKNPGQYLPAEPHQEDSQDSQDSQEPVRELQMPTTPVPTNDQEKTPANALEGQIIQHGDGFYRPEYAEDVIRFFLATPMTRTVVETLTWKNGEIREVEKEVANPPPMISEFARELGVTTRKLKSWAKDNPDFREALEECEQITKEFIVKNGLTGRYPSQFAIFAGKNLTDMKDKHINEHRTININDVLDRIEKGKPVHDNF